MIGIKYYKVEYHWVNDFVEKFDCAATEAAAKVWLKNGMSLDTVIRIVITDTEGEVLHDVTKENPFAEKPKKRATKKRTKKKKTVRKKSRTKSDE